MPNRISVGELYDRHAKTVYRVCFMYVKNPSDAEDMTHNVFVKLMDCTRELVFENGEHEKAFLIRTAQNVCKDFLKSAWAKRTEIPGNYAAVSVKENIKDTLNSVMALPEKYKIPIYLYYYEGYKTAEIAKILGKPESTVRGLLRRGRNILKLEMEEDYYEKTRVNGSV